MHCIPLHQMCRSTSRSHIWQVYWQIYPPIEHRCHEYHYTKLGRSHLADLPGRSTPQIEHKCLEYHYTKLGRSTDRSHIWQICLADLTPPPQLSIHALNTITPNLADLIFGRSAWQMYPYQLSIHGLYTITQNVAGLLADLIFGRSIGRSISPKLSIDALNTITPNLADLIFGRSAWEIYLPNLADLLADLKFGRLPGKSTPLPIEHR